MKLKDIIIIVERRNGMPDRNYLLDFTEYLKMATDLIGNDSKRLSQNIQELYQTKDKISGCAIMHTSQGKIIACFCRKEEDLRKFLTGKYNTGEYVFDKERCTENCLRILKGYNMETDGSLILPYQHYERLNHTFHVGESFDNFNGSEYYVLHVRNKNDLLVMDKETGALIDAKGVFFYERHPCVQTDYDSMVTGVEWACSNYLGKDITKIDFSKFGE